MKKKNGRPLKYDESDLDKISAKIAKYLLQQEADPRFVPTISGLAFAAGFTSRKQLAEYQENENLSAEFRNTIKRAVLAIESFVEGMCIKEGKGGQIFWLKNHGWQDKQETEITGKDGGAIIINYPDAKH